MILVTGGTGFVGQEVVKKLVALGQPVRVLIRHPDKKNPFAHLRGVEVAQGDVLKPETLAAAMTGVQAVIHLVGIITETSRVTYEEAHTEATRNVLAAAKGAGVGRWVQMSAIGTRPHARSRYHKTKWAAEELVRNSGLDWTILRPSLIYGYDEKDRLLNLLRMVLSWPLDELQLYSLPLLNGGESLIQPISVREVAHCFAHAPTKEAAIGRTFDLVGPVAMSWREMIFKILAALGKQGVYEEIPLLLFLRGLLWLAVILLPVLIVIGWMESMLSIPIAVFLVAIEIVLAATVAGWRKTIIFSLPGEPLILASEAANVFAPRELQASEPLKMAVEDNIGDPFPATRTFAYTPETFEQGLRTIYKR